MLACSFLIESSIKIAGNQDRHKSLDDFILGQIRLLTLELLALE